MKMSKAEKIAIAVTLLFLVFTAGIHLGTTNSRDSYEIRTQHREAPEQTEESDSSESPEVPAVININTADKQQLMELDGVGEKLAERIIEYRERKGSFKKAKDINKVPGISERIFEDNKDMITVS